MRRRISMVRRIIMVNPPILSSFFSCIQTGSQCKMKNAFQWRPWWSENTTIQCYQEKGEGIFRSTLIDKGSVNNQIWLLFRAEKDVPPAKKRTNLDFMTWVECLWVNFKTINIQTISTSSFYFKVWWKNEDCRSHRTSTSFASTLAIPGGNDDEEDGDGAHRSGAGIKCQQKMTTMETWTFYSRQLFLFARLSYYFIAVLRLTKSSTLLSAPVWPALSKFP